MSAWESFGDRRPAIEYPTEWGYRVIGADEAKVRSAIETVLRLVGGGAHTVRLSNRSTGGRWCAVDLQVVVRDEAERMAIFQALHVHGDVRMVI